MWDLIIVKHFKVINLTDVCFKLQSMTFSTKCACDDVCASNNDNPAENSNRPSAGSIILIVYVTDNAHPLKNDCRN